MTVAMKKTLTLLLLLAGLNMDARAETLIWNGSEGHMTWNFEDDNWLDEDGKAAVYQDGDAAVFGNLGSGNVVLDDRLKPVSMVVANNGGKDYTFDGNGVLAGSMSLTKTGEGKLTINTANEFHGAFDAGTVIQGGTVVVGHDMALGYSDLLLQGGTLDLGGHTLTENYSTTVEGAAKLGNGTLNCRIVSNYEVPYSLTLCGNLGGEEKIYMQTGCNLDLNGYTLSKDVVIKSQLNSIGNGTLLGNVEMDNWGQPIKLSGDLYGTGTICLGSEGRLDLNQKTLYANVVVATDEYGMLSELGDACLYNGTVAGSVIVPDGITYNGTVIDYLWGDLKVTGNFIVGAGSTLIAKVDDFNYRGNIIVSGNDATINMENIGHGTLVLADGVSFSCTGINSIRNATVGKDACLDLLGHQAGNVTIAGDGGSVINLPKFINLFVAEGVTCKWSKDTQLERGTLSLGDGSGIDLAGCTFDMGCIYEQGDNTTYLNGTISSDVNVANDKTIHLGTDLVVQGNIRLNQSGTIGLGSNCRLEGTVMGSGTILNEGGDASTLSGSALKNFTGSLEVQDGTTLNLMNADGLNLANVSIAANGTLGVYSNETPAEANEATLTIKGSKTLTAGKDATLNANLVMAGGSTLDVSAAEGNGGLHMGSTVTLAPGNVLLSEDDMDAVNGLRYMQAYDLFNGVDKLSLDNGVNFIEELGLADPWVKASEVFANDLFKSAEKEYYLFYSGKNAGGAGGNVGTVYLTLIPEPDTGTLSLLALAALAARRRRK